VQHLPLNEVIWHCLIAVLLESYNLHVTGVESVQLLSRQIVMLSGVFGVICGVWNEYAAKTVIKAKRLK